MCDMSHAAAYAFGEIFFFSLSCGILCVWGGFSIRCVVPHPDPQRQTLQDCKTRNCRVFLESNANHTELGLCVCVCVSVFYLSLSFQVNNLSLWPFAAVSGAGRRPLRPSGYDFLKKTRRSRKDFNLNTTFSQADRWYLMRCNQIINWLSEFHSLVSMATEPAISLVLKRINRPLFTMFSFLLPIIHWWL